MGELSFAEVFSILKPLCESFMNDADIKKVEEIGILVEKSPNLLLQKICENILYPIIYHLKKNSFSKDDNLKLISTMRIIISKTKIENLKFFYEIYYSLRTQIYQQKNSTELIESHEELKENVVLCLRDLFKNISLSIIESFYIRQNAALLSHGIYLCIKIARSEKSLSLRLAAIESVMVLLQVHDEADSDDIVLINQVADVVMLFLPGVVSGLLEVALGSDVQNHKIKVLAIRAWSRVLTLVMQDRFQEENLVISISMDTIKTKDSIDFERIKHVLEAAKRTPDWYNAVSNKFKIIFTELDNLTKHTHFQVRKELAEAVGCLLINCSRNMKPCFQIFLEILITLSEDENEKVAKEAKKAFVKIQDRCLYDESMKLVIETLEENLFDLLIKMPRVIRTAGNSLQIVWLNRLAGYLKIFGKQKLSRILLSTKHLKKLLFTLVYIAELDCSGISVLEDSAVTNFDEIEYYGISYSWKQFKFLYDSNSVEKLYNIFRILGETEDKKMLIDSILTMINDTPRFHKELILILNIMTEVPADPMLKISLSHQIVEQYISKDFWDLPVKISRQVSLQIVQNNIVLFCLLLEGLEKIAKVLQENYQHFLLKTLYLIIENAGNKHILIRFIGLSTLKSIAKSLKLESVGDLLQVNVDYITYHITLKLNRVERNPGILDVVNVVTHYSTIDFLPHLRDIVDDLLLQSGSNMQKCNAQSFLEVFLAFIVCAKRLTEVINSKEEKYHRCVQETQKPAEIIICKFLELQKAKQSSKMFEERAEFDNDSNENLEEEFIEEDKNIQIPYFVCMVKNIMKRCLHFLPSQNFTESSLAMSTLKEGIFILKKWEDELLPIVHELWHPLVNKFENSNPLIINQSWKLLCCLAQVSESFIRSRTLKQIFPAVLNFLKTSAEESFKKHNKSSYMYTQVFKLQKEILSGIGNLSKNLKLLEKDMWLILDIAEPYLHQQQNIQLQKCCVNMYKEISEYNLDIVLIKCADIWHRHVETVIPVNNLDKWYTRALHNYVTSNYHQNLQKILVLINEKI